MLAFGTVAISAGVIDNAHGTAVIAAINMAAQLSGATV
jgi:Zn-dependent M28 family amino/carboxypeptidase